MITIVHLLFLGLNVCLNLYFVFNLLFSDLQNNQKYWRWSPNTQKRSTAYNSPATLSLWGVHSFKTFWKNDDVSVEGFWIHLENMDMLSYQKQKFLIIIYFNTIGYFKSCKFFLSIECVFVAYVCTTCLVRRNKLANASNV